ncbi:hypothetical protein DY000_02063104 [Brassica cretica]|uniref:Uncharacterized protein n=1 Tax=Brassica cretica TaxID=69181 RepID=A0ABQ7AU71_BRACR|nr:hypothetical protein DY000_02063104 [Brassica cretica]
MRQQQGDHVAEELDAEMNRGGDELGHNRYLTTTTMEKSKTTRSLISQCKLEYLIPRGRRRN